MPKAIAGNGVRTIIVETASRFARDLMVQEVRFAKLRELGIELVTADSPNAFLDDGPTSKLIRQVLGAVAEFDKAMTVAKLRGARDRKRRELGKCEGRKSHAELRPEVVLEAKRLRRASPLNGKRRSFRKISRELAAMGYLSARGTPSLRLRCKPWSTMIGRPRPPNSVRDPRCSAIFCSRHSRRRWSHPKHP